MPFSHVRDQYQPEQIAQLTEAFERAWPQVALVNGAGIPVELELLRQRLANYIMACASQGDFDPEKLAEQAVRAFNKRIVVSSAPSPEPQETASHLSS
jgi:hypothetical protein